MTMHRVGELEGNSAGATYGVVKGFGRWGVRFGAGCVGRAAALADLGEAGVGHGVVGVG